MPFNQTVAEITKSLMIAQIKSNGVSKDTVIKIVEEIIQQDTILRFEHSVDFWEECKREIKDY